MNRKVFISYCGYDRYDENHTCKYVIYQFNICGKGCSKRIKVKMNGPMKWHKMKRAEKKVKNMIKSKIGRILYEE